MSHYRKIDVRIWSDRRVEDLSDDGKLLFVRLLTHPAMTSLGALPCTVAGLAQECNWTLERFGNALREILASEMAHSDAAGRMLWFPNFLKYNRPESPNVIRGWARAFERLPESDLLDEVVRHSKGFVEDLSDGFQQAFREAFKEALRKAPTKPSRKPKAYQEQEQEQISTRGVGETQGGGGEPPVRTHEGTREAGSAPLRVVG